MRGYIERGVDHRIRNALWASALGLAIASGTALASGPGRGDLPPGSAILGGPSVPPPRDIAIPMPLPVDLPDALPIEDVIRVPRPVVAAPRTNVEPDIDIPEGLDDKNLMGDDQRGGSSGYDIPMDDVDWDMSALSGLGSGDGFETPENSKIETPEPPEDPNADTED